MKSFYALIATLILSVLPGMLVAGVDDEFTDTFPIADCNFSTVGGNSYFILKPGRVLHFSGEEEDLIITVLSKTRNITLDIDGKPQKITTRVVQEFETADDEFAEESWNFFAVCAETGDVYYFGEEVWVPDENGDPVGGADGPGAWLAGVNGAMPGIIMPGGAFLLGARYYQEVAPDVALDRAEHTAMGIELEFEVEGLDDGLSDCVEVTETTPLDKHEESIKIYCPGVGLAVDDDLELIEVIE